MKLAGVPVSIILILFVAAFLFLKYSLSSSPLFLFSLFNTIILAIMVGSFRPSTCEVDEFLPFFCGSDELGVHTHDDIMENSDKDDDYDEIYHGSDGYVEDDDDNGSDDHEFGWEDEKEEGCDDNLQKRTEDFIAKAYSRWKEENLRDKLSPG